MKKGKDYLTSFIEQSLDLYWIIDSTLSITFANASYKNVIKSFTGKELQEGDPVIVEEFGEEYKIKWKKFYARALFGEIFEIQESFYNPESKTEEFSIIRFNPIKNSEGRVIEVACHSRDITSTIRLSNEAEKLLDASLDVICSISQDGNFIKVSAACKELWGYEKHELVGKPFIDFVLDEDKDKTIVVTSEILSGKTFTTFENRYIRKDGGVAFNLWSVRYDPEAKTFYCVARDASEKIKKEELLLESENRFRSLVQEGSDLIAILNQEGVYTYVSPTSMGILGMSPDEFIGKNAFDFIHPEDTEKALDGLNKIFSESRVVIEPFRFQNKAGEWRWVETVLTNMLNNPSIRGIVANSRDITAARNETQHLKLLETVVTNANDIILITEAEPQDKPGPRIVYVNDAFTKLTGYTREEVIGKTPRILQGPKSDYAALEKLGKALRNWEPYEITAVNYKKNGEEFWINFTVIPVANERGCYTHWFAIERDVTEKKNLEIAKDLTAKTSALFNEEFDLHSALTKLCQEVAVLGQFSFCEIWLTDIQERFLELKAFHQKDEAATIFYRNSKQDRVFEKGHGLPGSIWENNKSIIWENKGENHQLLTRSTGADKAGIKTIVGFPLNYHDKFIGVLQFGTQSTTKNIEWIVKILRELGLFIGSEIARKKTEIELSKIFEFAPDVIAIAGFDGFFKTVNPYTSKLLGYSDKELTSKPFSEFIHPDDVEGTQEELSKLPSGAPIYNLRNRYITKTGEIKTISWNISPSIEDGLVFYVGKDISEEIKIASLLKNVNQLSRIGSWEIDMIHQTLYWSDMVYEIHEADMNLQVNLQNAIDFYRSDYHDLVKSELGKCIKSGSSFDFEAIIVTTKNKEVWVRAMGRAEMMNGEPVRIYGSFQDINQKKTTEIRLKSIANNLPGAIVQFQLFPDGTDQLLHLSKGSEKLWEIDVEAGMKNNALIWDQISEAGDLDKVRASINESMTSMTAWHVHFRSKSPNGKIKWLEGSGTPRKQADGSTIWDSIILDITNLKEAEELLATASKMARVASWELSLQGNKDPKMYWSPLLKDILEIDQAFDPPLGFGLNLHKEPSRSILKEAMTQLVQTGEVFDLELNLLTAKGNDRWVRIIGNAKIRNNKVVQIFGSFQDIHLRKIAELNQIKLLEDKNKILESIGDAFFAVDKKWIVTYWNRIAEVIFGKKREDIVGRSLWEEYSDMLDTKFYSKYHYAMETQETVSFEEFYETSQQWVEVTAYPSSDGLSVFFKDITNKKEFDLKIQEANERFEKATEATADAIWDWDIVNDKFYRGNKFIDLFGYEIDYTQNHLKFYEKNFHKHDLPKLKESVNNALLNPEVTKWEFQYRINHPSGIIKRVLDKGVIIRDSTGKAIRMIGAITDITYIIDHEKELLDLNHILQTKLTELESAYEELEQFTYIASHDLQEPLRMVSSFMDQLKRKYGDQMDDKAHQYIEFAIDGAKRMKQIILDLLEYSRAGKIQEALQSIDLNQCLEEYKILRRKVIAEKKAVLVTDTLPIIETYTTPLVQVLHNLLDNAIKYSKNNVQPIVQISCKDRNEFWEICIQDNGIGIDNKYFNKIFVIFQRLHDRDQFAGTGIGLSIVKKQIEFLGGNIWIESKINEGSKFYFTIPK
ncbi:PAS domain S-box protein [Algoriphagus sp. C2-6-M1]|uniref:PAS domain S-box protein n=1 Tax=Algoriphagus persicinus TaxID=3108754 RepID=UPI002B3FFAE9|nr:PAS domain S-box protein [Algoriphagus sp. C2-6-M1]MEB2782039.1 PAS domain S-box protein [Algoriphagus sp. C2-6-M1]